MVQRSFDDAYPILRGFIYKIIKWMKAHPRIDKPFARFARWYEDQQGFREFGLKRDDLVSEELAIVREAIGRLSEKEIFDRTFRIRRAFQLYITGERLPKEEQIPFEKVDYVLF